MLLYILFSSAYFLLIRLSALFNPKARLAVKGRRQSREKLLNHTFSDKPRIWFHCASLGEFEQARPVLEKMDRSKYEILLSFFSPSGYEIRKDYQGVDLVFYLPFDSPWGAKKLIRLLKPQQVVFVKYEFWYFTLREIARNHIPLYLVSARFRPGQPFFRGWGKIYRRMLGFFSMIFVQDEASGKLLASIGINVVKVAGDTRFDRVYENSLRHEKIPVLESFREDKLMLVAGSTWPEEELLISRLYSQFPELKWVIAPHDISVTHVAGLKLLFGDDACFFSHGVDPLKPVLVIDSIGLLADAYASGDLALVGGGFKQGLHNILEPAVFGLPVIFGPRTEKYPEGDDLCSAGGGFKVVDADSLKAILDKMTHDEKFRKASGKLASEWVIRNRGAAGKILDHISLA